MDVWHESVPERDGKATADLALPGCTVGIGPTAISFPQEHAKVVLFERPAKARAQLATEPGALEPNIPVLLTFRLQDYQGNPIADLVLDHNRIAHVIIASNDFSVFSHIHAEDSGPVTPQMLKTRYFLCITRSPSPANIWFPWTLWREPILFSDQFYLKVGLPNTTGSAMTGPASDPSTRQENIGGYGVTFKTSPARLRAGVAATLNYHVTKDGKPFTEMNPYLAVPMHISIIRDDLMGFLHIHGLLPVSLGGKLLGESIHASHLLLPDKFGPDIEATNFTFPSAGIYHIFGEFSAEGKVVVSQFTVRVDQ